VGIFSREIHGETMALNQAIARPQDKANVLVPYLTFEGETRYRKVAVNKKPEASVRRR